MRLTLLRFSTVSAALLASASAVPAMAAPGDPIAVRDGITIDPIIAARLRYESVDQDNALRNADALTARLRAGAEVKVEGFSLLLEGEGTAALIDDYNDTLLRNGVEPYSVVADPETLELNRAQIAYSTGATTITAGRQRIVLDDARFVGNVIWRQNEQTYDAVRLTSKAGPVSIDATYAGSQRTVFGNHSPNEHFDGDMVFLNSGVKLAQIDVKAFAYLIDYDDRIAFSSQTYGLMSKGSIPLGSLALNFMARAATQSDYKDNPASYSAPYFNGELGASVAGFSLAGGYEELGSDEGVAAFQTPLATLHAFNGWADLFLTTPATGLRDYYARVGKAIPVPGLATFNATLVYHQFDSDFGSIDYGSEWDAQIGLNVGSIALLAKYANYNAKSFAVDTEKFWLQAELNF